MGESTGDIFTAYFPVYLIAFISGYAPYFIRRGRNHRYLARSNVYLVLSTIIQISTLSYMWITWFPLLQRTYTGSILYEITYLTFFYLSFLGVSCQVVLSKIYIRRFIENFNRLNELQTELNRDFDIKFSWKTLGFLSILPVIIAGVSENCHGFSINTAVSSSTSSTVLVVLSSGYLLSTFEMVSGEMRALALIFHNAFRGVRKFLIRNHLTLSPHVFIDEAHELSCVITLKRLSRIHQELCEILSVFNRIGSIQLLFAFAISYCYLCIWMFVLVLSLFSTYMYSRIGPGIIVVCATTLLKLGTTIISSSLCIDEMNQLKKVLYKMSTLRSFKLRKEINNFSLQLFHDRIEITAAGFFVVDAKIIFSIVAAITMHTIILVQFDPKVNVFGDWRIR